MKRSMTVLRYAQLLILMLTFAAASAVAQDMDEQQFTMSYEGELLDAAENAVTASYGMTFRMYRESEGGEAIWVEIHDSVEVIDGKFFVDLGSISAFDAALAQETVLFLALEVGEGGELSPRMKLGGSLRSAA